MHGAGLQARPLARAIGSAMEPLLAMLEVEVLSQTRGLRSIKRLLADEDLEVEGFGSRPGH